MASVKERTRDNRQLPADQLEAMYTTMKRIRAFEQRTFELFNEGIVKGTAHSYMGEEAIAAGVCAALTEKDYIASYHRGHGHCIAKGAAVDRMMAELMGRETGYCRGLGGSMHIADMNLNILGANGIVGAAMPLAVGAGLASRLRGEGQVSIAFFGDGANNQGVFHESLNLASVWKLPVIFVCENNQYALSTSYRQTTAVEQVAMRAPAYDIPGITIDGNDAAEVYLVVSEAVERARAGDGPTLIEAMTYRWGQHSMRVNLRDPRPEEEFEEWKARDPIVRMEEIIDGAGGISGKRMKEIGKAVDSELEEAVSFGTGSPEPSIQVMQQAVYAPHVAVTEPGPGSGRDLSFVEALNEAIHGEMERDDSVFIMGEDVGLTGGIFQVSKGLIEKFGEERGARHADLGSELRRLRGRRGDFGHASDRGNPDLRLRGADHGHAGQPGGQVPFHAGREAQRAAGRARAAGRRHPARGAAQPEPRGVVHARPRPRRGRPVDALRREGPPGVRDSRRQPGDLPRIQDALPWPAGSRARGALRHSHRQGRHQAPRLRRDPWSPPPPWCRAPCLRRRCWRATASTSRSSIRARSSRWTRTRSLSR